jgi:hypothetical protein
MAKQHISLMKRKFAKTFRYEFLLLIITAFCVLFLSHSRELHNILTREMSLKIFLYTYVREQGGEGGATAYL